MTRFKYLRLRLLEHASDKTVGCFLAILLEFGFIHPDRARISQDCLSQTRPSTSTKPPRFRFQKRSRYFISRRTAFDQPTRTGCFRPR